MDSLPDSPYAQWISIPDRELSVDDVQNILGPIQDELWVVAACTDRVVDDIVTQRALLQLGLSRSDSVIQRCKDVLTLANATESRPIQSPLVAHFQAVPADAELCNLRSILLQRLDKLNTYVELQKIMPQGKGVEDEEEVQEWEDDPWEDEATTSQEVSTEKEASSAVIFLPIFLSEFLLNNLLWSACKLATLQCFSALRILFQKHTSSIWPYRFALMETIPEFVDPTTFRELLPSFNPATNFEPIFISTSWRDVCDFSELPEVQSALKECGPVIETLREGDSNLVHMIPVLNPLTADDLSKWYRDRVHTIISHTGMVDISLALIQHGASQGVPSLDEFGEDLSLLSRLVYDAPEGTGTKYEWTLTRWQTMDPPSIIRAYLEHSTPESLALDISQLVMPYLYVLESRAERIGKPDPSLPDRLLYEYILNAPLEMAASVFEASKPTLPSSQRLIRNDEDIVRLAIACLYGSNSLDEWPTMSAIFECLPAWDIAEDDDHGAADTTVASLGTFVIPNTTRPTVTATDILTFLKPLSVASLSKVLDILDIHLESGEILSRWSVPAPLRWFLQSRNNVDEQRAWANRMSRRAGGTRDHLNTQEDWEWLLNDMLKLTKKGDTGLHGAFGLLSRDEVVRVFFSGLLSSGRFGIARALLNSPKTHVSLDTDAIEDLCMSCSRELYDNSSSGNYKFGDMKLAYDCLDVPQPSDRLVREKDFIEATSRISSFNVTSRPGIPISPIEIRLTKDRLSLISRVLSSNSDAYKHTEVILDLCYKLGFRDDHAAEVKVLAMLANTALQAEDFARAYENSLKMVDAYSKLRTFSFSVDNPEIREATEVCWIACFQLGRQPEFDDLGKKMSLLGYALEFCPPDKINDIVSSWRRLEKEDMVNREERLVHKTGGISAAPEQHKYVDSLSRNVSSLRARLQDFHMPSPPMLSTPDAAALASRTFKSVAANFPFSVGQRGRSQFSDTDGSESRRSGSLRRMDVEDVSAQATRVFSKGIGWLIGSDAE